MSIHTTHTTPGTLYPHCPQHLQVTENPHSDTPHTVLLVRIEYISYLIVSAGTLISHEKLLLQINTEREMGNMDYKLGQVGER